MSTIQASIDNLTDTAGYAGSHFSVIITVGAIALLILLLTPVVIAVVRGNRAQASQLFISGMLGCLALASFIAFPAGLYLFYKNFELALSSIDHKC